MNARPIIFNLWSIQRILAGEKTQTRRVVKPQPVYSLSSDETLFFRQLVEHCKYGRVGDRLWVRETCVVDIHGLGFYWADYDPETKRNVDGVSFDAEAGLKRGAYRKIPSIFMPRKYSRITLEITDVRVQRLQDISEDDAYAEGVTGGDWLGDPIGAYIEVWNDINAKRGFSWESNPWIWAITFKYVSPELAT